MFNFLKSYVMQMFSEYNGIKIKIDLENPNYLNIK